MSSDATEIEQQAEIKGHTNQARKDIEKVTDYAEEAEVDAAKLSEVRCYYAPTFNTPCDRQ